MRTQRERLVAVIEDVLGKQEEELTNKTRLCDDLGCDSMDICEIVMAVEDEFLIDAPDDILHSWKSVGDIFKWLSDNAPTEERVAKVLARKVT